MSDLAMYMIVFGLWMKQPAPVTPVARTWPYKS